MANTNHRTVHFSDIKQHDVMLGKGNPAACHIGTIAFKAIIESRLDTYVKATTNVSRKAKTALTLEVLEMILPTGGCFLRQHKADHWHVLSEKEARIKVRDSFRDCVKNIRNKRQPSAFLKKIGISQLVNDRSKYMDIVDHVANSSDIREIICSRKERKHYQDLIEQKRDARSDLIERGRQIRESSSFSSVQTHHYKYEAPPFTCADTALDASKNKSTSCAAGSSFSNSELVTLEEAAALISSVCNKEDRHQHSADSTNTAATLSYEHVASASSTALNSCDSPPTHLGEEESIPCASLLTHVFHADQLLFDSALSPSDAKLEPQGSACDSFNLLTNNGNVKRKDTNIQCHHFCPAFWDGNVTMQSIETGLQMEELSCCSLAQCFHRQKEKENEEDEFSLASFNNEDAMKAVLKRAIVVADGDANEMPLLLRMDSSSSSLNDIPIMIGGDASYSTIHNSGNDDEEEHFLLHGGVDGSNDLQALAASEMVPNCERNIEENYALLGLYRRAHV